MEPKKARDWNFSCEESVLLLDLVLKYKDIVENKSMAAIIRNEKRNAWRNITEEFNASAEHKRSLRALKLKYETMKKFLKKKFIHYENSNLESSYEQLPLCAPVDRVSSIFSLPVQDNINVNENGDIQAITEEVNDNLIHNIKSEIPEFEQEPIILDTNQEVAFFNSEFRKRTINTSAETEQISDVNADLHYKPIHSPKKQKPMNNNCYTLKQELLSLQIKSLKYDINMKQIYKKMNELKMKVLTVDLQIKQAELKIKERQLRDI